jgi:hypothetical protein
VSSGAARQFLNAFSRALAQHQPVRVAWLACLRSQTATCGPRVPVHPRDEALLARAERRLPDNPGIRLSALMGRIALHAPALLDGPPGTDALIFSRLTGAILAYQRRQYPDPLQPWARRGRPRRDLPQERQAVLRLIRLCYQNGWEPTQPRVAELKLQEQHEQDPPTLDSIVRSFRRLGPWNTLKAMARAL